MLVEVLFGMTNQPALVALLLHRARSSSAAQWFKAASVWEAISKNLRLVAIAPIYLNTWDQADSVCDSQCKAVRLVYPLLGLAIWAANMYMVWVLWQLATHSGEKLVDLTSIPAKELVESKDFRSIQMGKPLEKPFEPKKK